MTDTIDIISSDKSHRHSAERRFRAYGIAAITISLGFLVVMVGSILLRGTGALQQTFVQIEITLPADKIDPDGTGDPEVIRKARYGSYLKQALRERFPQATSRSDKRALYKLISATAEYDVRDTVIKNPGLIGTTASFWVRSSSDLDMYMKGNIDASLDESQRRISDQQLKWIDDLKSKGQIELRFNTQFFTGGDSREPEQAGILGAVMGSALTLLVCFLLAFPLGVLA
ncbi:MAG: DUF3333 domain-containing protein, partial [Rhizobiaceae bacterium]